MVTAKLDVYLGQNVTAKVSRISIFLWLPLFLSVNQDLARQWRKKYLLGESPSPSPFPGYKKVLLENIKYF